MFKRKLQALDYPSFENVNINNEKEYRSIILWLEDQKIRSYKIHDRKGLRDLESADWQKAFDQYKKDSMCPIESGVPNEELEWFLAFAVRLEYADNKEKYRKEPEVAKSSAPNVVAQNALDNLDFTSHDFKNGVNALAKILKIAEHPDHLLTLKAVRKVVSNRLTPEALAHPEQIIIKGSPFPFEDTKSGYSIEDNVTKYAAKILRLLYIQNQRQLQTSINELIVAVQSVTANPKTDTKIGQVGR